MPEWIMIRLKDFYKDAVGEIEQVPVTEDVYEMLANVFRKEAHAQYMKDYRNRAPIGYTEGVTEDMITTPKDSVEETVLRHLDLEVLQKALLSLTEVQRQRLYLYYLEGMTISEIAARQHVNRNAVWKSIQGGLNQIKQFYEL